MASVRVVAAVFSGLSLAACGLPTPDYKVIQYPAPYRKEATGAVLDNEDIVLDAQGYRVDKQGNRIGEVDIQAKTANEKSGTSGSQFFVVNAEDAQLPPEYALLGKVTKGLDVVDKISAVPTTSDDQPADPVVIKSIKVK